MDYLTVEQARDMPGLRLILHVGMPVPWSEAAKSIFKIKGVDFSPVGFDPLGATAAQHAWTGHVNAPVAIYESEPARAGWAEILMLAERLQPSPALLPAEPAGRVEVLGLGHLICGEQGFGWTRRLVMARDIVAKGDQATRAEQVLLATITKYGYSPVEAATAATRNAAILTFLAQRLHRQGAAGSDYFVGDTLSAVDIYWACFAALLDPLPHAVNPMRSFLRAAHTNTDQVIQAALDPILLRHRDRIYDEHIGLPLSY